MNVAESAYRSVKRASIAEGSTPHSLIAQLYNGAIDSISVLIHTDNQNAQLKTHHINKSVAIINELQASLHRPDEDEIAGSLFSLYTYIVDQLQLERNINSGADLQACLTILNSLHEAWSEIAIDQQNQ